VRKGSIAVDGVSLTVSDLAAGGFEVCLIPHTWEQTSLRERQPGDTLNLETDMLGKYVRRCLDISSSTGLTMEKLTAAGIA